MSCSPSTSTSFSKFRTIFVAAMNSYEEKTKTNLLTHPLATQLQSCASSGDIRAVLHDKVNEFDKSRSRNDRLSSWLGPTINVLYTFSATVGQGVGLIFSPVTIISAGTGVLFLAAKDVGASGEALADLFQRIESFFRRLHSNTEVPPTDAMTDIMVKIMVEVLNIFAIATKEIKQCRTRKFLKKLMGRSDIEDALRRLDSLTRQEALLAAAQALVIKDVTDPNVVLQRTPNNVDDVRWNQLRVRLNRWVTPPDPSTNHNIACDIRHEGTAEWFFQISVCAEWKSNGCLLWIYGKPGSGKSVICSMVIQDIASLHELVAYFYFDFRDLDKQHRRNLLPSLLIQLSSQSRPCCDVLSRLHSANHDGCKIPSDGVMIQCLKDMLATLHSQPVYIILDALDECPNWPGIPSPREQVLALVKELVDLHLPHLRICVTSRPEADIRATFTPLEYHRISLHDESGHKKDIVDYINSVVYSDSETMMKRWREDDKKLVVEVMSEKADGMFRWVCCQLDVLRQCLPSSLRRTLAELPDSLDETYERIVIDIKKGNREGAYRMLQCLAVSIRPLSVAELADILAFDFNTAAEEIPKFNSKWRWEDHKQAVLSTCSGLITIVPSHDSQVVQFSHFSVKEFLLSDRLATSTRDISQYRIVLEDANTLITRACLGVLLRDPVDKIDAETAPLARYAAEHWVTHARVEDVTSCIHNGMVSLFDPDKPYFSAWVMLHNADRRGWSQPGWKMQLWAAPLYHAAFIGFHKVVEHLALEYPRLARAISGGAGTALHSASHAGHVEVVRALLKCGVYVDDRGFENMTPLRHASNAGHLNVVSCLLDHGANANIRDDGRRSPLSLAAEAGYLEIVRVLLEHHADVHTQDKNGFTPLHSVASYHPDLTHPQVVRLLLEHGANPNARDTRRRTPLHVASSRQQFTFNHSSSMRLEIVRILLAHGADVDAEDNAGRTPLQVAVAEGQRDIMELLSEYCSK